MTTAEESHKIRADQRLSLNRELLQTTKSVPRIENSGSIMYKEIDVKILL